MAEKAIAPAGNCWKIPDAMPFDQAAALLMTYGTSQHALKDRAQLRAGETLLVLGAAGGVGLAAVELGKAMGARVIAAASSPEKLALAREHGADEGVQYPPAPLDKNAARALDRQLQGGVRRAGRACHLRRASAAITARRRCAPSPGPGRHLVVGFTAGIPKLPLNLPLLKGCEIVGVFWGEFTAPLPGAARGQCCGADGAVSWMAKSSRPSPNDFRWRAAARRSPAWVRARRAAKIVVTVE